MEEGTYTVKRLRIKEYKGEQFGAGLLIMGGVWFLSFLFLTIVFDRAWIAFMAITPVILGVLYVTWMGITMIYDSLEWK